VVKALVANPGLNAEDRKAGRPHLINHRERADHYLLVATTTKRGVEEEEGRRWAGGNHRGMERRFSNQEYQTIISPSTSYYLFFNGIWGSTRSPYVILEGKRVMEKTSKSVGIAMGLEYSEDKIRHLFLVNMDCIL